MAASEDRSNYETNMTIDDEQKMPEKSPEFIEAECLRVARLQPGCRELKTVRIGRTRPQGTGPNWEVLGFTPDLPPIAKDFAVKAIHTLRQVYALI